MKAVAYSVLPGEKEYFAKANKRKHDITLIANPLGMNTVHYAEGKEAIIMPEGVTPLKAVINKLCAMGVKYIISRRKGNNPADLEEIAEKTIHDLDRANDNNRLLPVC
ncbi:hypothetical protein ACFQ3S_07540 [Mucilaginibacter terrae]|uniref:hypothetical protein n=1 Tax=Mucilaginibacter terrae TaxID=1955052 RepID=UPI00362D7FE9